MLRKLVKGQSGFSLIQGMMLAAAVAGMAYVGTKLTTDQKLAQKGAESKDRVEQLHSMIYSVLQNKDHCTATLLAGTPPAIGGADHVAAIKTKENATVFVNNSMSAGNGIYMNNAVSINDISIFYPADFKNHANLEIKYGKIDSKNMATRTGKGYGGTEVKKTIKLKIQTDPATSAFESCYAVDEEQNQNMVKDFCDKLGDSSDNLFKWDPDHQKCILNDVKCPSGEIFTGFNSNGKPQCSKIQDWMDFSELIDLSSQSTCDAATSSDVRFVVLGNKVKIECTPGAAGCTDACECPGGAMMVCESGVCVDRGLSPTCINGTYTKGDSFCRSRCSGGYWTCPAGPYQIPVCGGSAVNCVGSWSACVSNSKTYTVTTPASGGGTDCPAYDGETQACVSCTPTNGGWSAWGAYGACSGGIKTRYRTCNNPARSCGGFNCVGSNSSTLACGGCFVAGTSVEMADGSAKNIEDILLGDKLRDSENKIVNVKKLLIADYWGDIHSINGGPYFFTPNHPFLTLDGWKSLAPEVSQKESPGLNVTLMKTGDILVKKTGLELILTIDAKVTEEKIYNFQLDGSHTYLADEYKVHNKCASMACPIGFHWFSCDPTNCTGTCNDNSQPDPYCI